MSATSAILTTSVHGRFAIPCFPEPIDFRSGQRRLPLERHIPAHVLAAFSEGMLRLIAPAGLRFIADPAPPALPVAPVTTHSITPLMAQVESIVQRLARSIQPMPGNPELGQLAGGRGRNSVHRALDRLTTAGRIEVEIKDSQRRVRIIATGSVTAWGPFTRNPHAPYSARARGEVTPEAKVEVKRADYEPVQGEPFRYRVEPQKLVAVGPSPTCCWPLWSDDEAPVYPAYPLCDCLVPNDLRQAGFSYCAEHQRISRIPVQTRPGNRRQYEDNTKTVVAIGAIPTPNR